MTVAPASSPSAVWLPTFDDLPDGLVVVDGAGCVREANLAFLSMVQRARQEVVAQPLEQLVAEEDMLHLLGFQALFGAGPLQDGHIIFTASDGSRRPLIISSGSSRDQRYILITARVSGMVQRELADASRWVAAEQERSMSLAQARDALAAKNAALLTAQADLEQAYLRLQKEASTREKLERELSAARKLEAIGQLSAGVAHEINTPLQYVGDSVHFLGQAFARITSYAERVTRLSESTPAISWTEAQAALVGAAKETKLAFVLDEIPQAVRASKEGIEQVSKIVQALKAFAHQDQEERGPSDLNAAVRNALVMAQHEYKNVAVAVEELGDLPLVHCSLSQLNQVFLNLIVNAAHAIEDARKEDRGTIVVRTRAVDDFAEITIADDGCGIPDAIRHKVFEPFFTTKEVGRGSGQGLALAREVVVERHGGTVTFESEAGKGTVFKVRVPIDGSPGQARGADLIG
jgi:signal transduction histidine kinase